MSRRDRAPVRPPARPPAAPAWSAPREQPGRTERTAPPDQPRSLREQLATARVAAAALLPIRFFFGVTFVYAGLDKLVDPAFFDAASPVSIQAQLAAFTRVSPLAPLVRIGEPFAVPLGLLIAIAEIAIGLGALTGLAYRFAALGGATLSLLFWLTASWATHPYYYGPDLPYAAGWLTLALAGHGGLLVPRRVLELGEPAGAPVAGRTRGDVRGGARGDGWSPRPPGGWPQDEPALLDRRAVLQLGVLGAAALVVASLAAPLRLFRGSSSTTGSGTGDGTGAIGTTPAPGASATPAPTLAPGATPAATAGGGNALAVAKVSDVEAQGAVAFTVPLDAPAPLPAGDPGVIVKLANGKFAAYDAVCTHEGCTVEWDAQDSVLLCPCHGAAFDPAQSARVLQGPTRQPLASLPIKVDSTTGSIVLTA